MSAQHTAQQITNTQNCPPTFCQMDRRWEGNNYLARLILEVDSDGAAECIETSTACFAVQYHCTFDKKSVGEVSTSNNFAADVDSVRTSIDVRSNNTIAAVRNEYFLVRARTVAMSTNSEADVRGEFAALQERKSLHVVDSRDGDVVAVANVSGQVKFERAGGQTAKDEALRQGVAQADIESILACTISGA